MDNLCGPIILFIKQKNALIIVTRRKGINNVLFIVAKRKGTIHGRLGNMDLLFLCNLNRIEILIK